MSKVQVQSVHAIEITLKPGENGTKDKPAVRPITRTIKPKTLFEMESGADLDELFKAGAVREPNGEHKFDLRAEMQSQESARNLQTGSQAANPGAGSNPPPAGAELQETGEAGSGDGDSAGRAPNAPKASAQTGASHHGRVKSSKTNEDLV